MKKFEQLLPKGDSRHNKIRVATVVFSGFPRDPRPRREAEALIEAGLTVDMFCIQKDNEPRKERLKGVTVYRTKVKKKRTTKSRYLWQYSYFFFAAFIKITFYHLLKRYSIIHIHNMPDFLVFTAIIPKLTGAKILLDLHDPMPEMFITKYSRSKESRFIRMLKFFEKKSILFADKVITPNKSFVDLFISRGASQSKINIIMNSPQEDVFIPVSQPEGVSFDKTKLVIMYHGVIVKRYGLDTALYSISKLKDNIPKIRFEVFGSGDFETEFKKLRAELGLEEIVIFNGSAPLEKIASMIGRVDLGIIPNRATTFTKLNFPTRIFEYLCLGKPVIVPRTQGIQDYFKEDEIYYFNPDDGEDLTRVILHIYNNPDECFEKIKKGFEVYKKFTWYNQKRKLLDIIGEMSDLTIPSSALFKHENNNSPNIN